MQDIKINDKSPHCSKHVLPAVPLSEVYLEDCVTALKRYADNHFDLAIVDPPYGIGFGEFNRTNKSSNGERYKANKYKNSNWDDDIPSDEYFAELMRVSKNQIVWGGNYFPYLWQNGCKGFIYWHKGNPVPNFADGELAWTSFNKVAKQFDFRYYGNLQGKIFIAWNIIIPVAIFVFVGFIPFSVTCFIGSVKFSKSNPIRRVNYCQVKMIIRKSF